MTSRLHLGNKRGRAAIGAAILAMSMALMVGTPARAQTTFDVIGPKEYDLPVNFDPFNVFVQYAYVQDNSKVWSNSGESIVGDGSQALVGLSKYVYFWTPEFNRNVGVAWEIIQPEISVRNSKSQANPDGSQVSGFGDTITGFATWFKPTPASTLGVQSFVQIPIGDTDVSDQTWKNLSSVLWYTPIGSAFDWTGNAGFVWQSSKPSRVQPAMLYHTNNRFGWLATDWLEPFIALDYEYIGAYAGFNEAWSFDGGLGFMIDTFENQWLTLRYSQSLAGKNHSYNDSWNLKYAVVW
ncbi:hypothetical protein AUC70_06015 [Methyloceanibacter stevinii]|uniref:Phenol degradation protein meta n=1 Tax=Methyloceanibacter stevinii TaxID=1774970 RepID=A0A1E3VP84_9HYPH|nr:hypothetical protein AUC70_06015 [Methyloceanibacter stevinii]